MNNVDQADHLRGVYRWDTFMGKRKWWWSILFWCMQMLQTNSYIMYCKYMEIHSQEPISHLEFCKRICLAWLDPHNNWPRHVKLAARNRDREQTSQASAERSVTTSSRNSLSTITTRSSAKNLNQKKGKKVHRYLTSSNKRFSQ